MGSLLPPNATALERRIEQVSADLVAATAPLDDLWDAQRMPAHMLPWLGWATGVDHWSADWSEQVKRDAIDEAIPIRRKRGTVWAVRRALEALGFSDVEILEHAKQDAAWREAGGLYIDSSWSLDGSEVLGGDLVDPPQVVTTNWAQYALAFNIADAPFTATDQQRVRDRVEAAAPLRAELVALLYRYAVAFNARITVSPLSQAINQNWSQCQGAQVHHARQLMGCWSLSGDYEPRLVDGRDRLNGAVELTGQRAIGDPLNHGWGNIDIQVKQKTTAAAQAVTPNAWTLGETDTDRLDGSWSLNETTDGHRDLDGSWPLSLSQVYQVRRPPLDGMRVLGATETINSIGTTAHAVLRDRRQLKEIRL